MIQKILAVVALVMSFTATWAQEAENKIALTPMVSEESALSDEARNILKQKLLQMCTANDFGSMSGDFVLTADLQPLDRRSTATVPAQYIVEYEAQFYVMAVAEKVIVKEFSQKIRGLERSEEKALINALKRINPRTAQVRRFMRSSREKIVDYYAQRIPQIVAKAQSLQDRGAYEEALAVLNAVPECVEEYPIVADKMRAVYIEMVDKFAETALQDARAKFAVGDYKAAVEAVVFVDPMSNFFADAQKLVEEVKAVIDEKERAAMERELDKIAYERKVAEQMRNDKLMLERLKIESANRAKEANNAETEERLSGMQEWLNENLK